MANWGSVKVVEDVEVVSVEHVEETDPKVYLKRAKIFIGYEKYAEAEQEYLQAVKYSGKNIRYIEELLTFYYSTKQDVFKKKADKLLDVWWKRKTLTQLIFYVISCFAYLLLANCIHEGGGWREFDMLSVAVAGCCFNLLPNRKKRIFDIVVMPEKSDKAFMRWFACSYLSPCFVISPIISLGIVKFVSLNLFGDIVNKIIVVGCVIAAVVTFQKGIRDICLR